VHNQKHNSYIWQMTITWYFHKCNYQAIHYMPNTYYCRISRHLAWRQCRCQMLFCLLFLWTRYYCIYIICRK